jgi:hypothetical protein
MTKTIDVDLPVDLFDAQVNIPLIHQVVALEHVVGVELVERDQLNVGDVAQALGRQRIIAVDDHQHAGALGDAAEDGDGRLGGRRVTFGQRLDDMQATVAGPVGQGAAQGSSLELLGRALFVVARRRAMHHATTGVLRCADRALAGTAGALLAVRLPATAGNLAAALGRVRALARSGQLSHNTLVDQRDVDLGVDDVDGQVDVDGQRGFALGHVRHRPSQRCG